MTVRRSLTFTNPARRSFGTLVGFAAGVVIGANHAINRPEVNVGKDVNLGSRRGRAAVGGREGQAGAIVDLRVDHVVVLACDTW